MSAVVCATDLNCVREGTSRDRTDESSATRREHHEEYHEESSTTHEHYEESSPALHNRPLHRRNHNDSEKSSTALYSTTQNTRSRAPLLVVVPLILTCRCRSPARPEFGNFLAHLHHGLLQGRHLGLLYGRRHVIFGPLGGPILVARGRPIVFLTPTVRFLHGPRPENKRTTSRVILLGPIYFVATGKKLLGRHRRDGGGSGGDHRF